MFKFLAQATTVLAQTAPLEPPPPASDPGQVTTAWMAGVVGIMLLFGVIAFVGYLRKPAETAQTE